jgi:aminopeptidase N
MATVVERIADIADRLARALCCWSAAWDMTRDGEMAARYYVTVALRGIADESEIGVVQSIQSRLRGRA